MFRASVLAGCLATLPFATPAATGCADDLMLVFDASGSMAETGFGGISAPSRIADARAALRSVLPNIAGTRRMGLVVYGPGAVSGCSHVELRFQPTENAGARILDEVTAIEPDGNTALVEAVEDAAQVLEDTEGRGTIVLVTDGRENCGGATCELAVNLAQRGITVHVVGVTVAQAQVQGGTTYPSSVRGDPTQSARCLADVTGGFFVSAGSTDSLESALNWTLGCPVYGRFDGPAVPRRG